MQQQPQRAPTLDAPSPANRQGEDPALTRSQQSRDQALVDTTSRIMGGMYVYVALWLVITLVAGLQRTHPVLVWGATAWLGLISATRALLANQVQTLLEHHAALTHRLTVGLVLANGLTWGLLSATSICVAELEPIRTAMLLVAVGLSSGGTAIMAINPILKNWFPIAVIAPLALATLTEPSASNVMLAALMAVYTVYIVHSASIVSKDYWRAQEAFQALERASLTDSLTQIANRLHFDRQYQTEWRRACRLNTRLAILIIDIDHFKRINDEHGHPAGDKVLQEAAKAMQQAIKRRSDVLARYGGEEFIVLLPDITEGGAEVVAERLREEVERMVIELPSRRINITCSVGHASVVPGHEWNPDELIRQADEALYRAKSAGRNRCREWAPPATAEPQATATETDRALT